MKFFLVEMDEVQEKEKGAWVVLKYDMHECGKDMH